MIRLKNVKRQLGNSDRAGGSGSGKLPARLKRRAALATVIMLAALALAQGLNGGLLVAASGGAEAPPEPHPAATHGHEPYPRVESDEAATLRFPLEEFDDGIARYYTYMHGDQPIEFFILKSDDGEVRAAFNACDACYRSQFGYSQDGQSMVCNNCGQRFPAEKINIVRGGCNPAPLARIAVEAELVIRVEDVIEGAYYFLDPIP